MQVTITPGARDILMEIDSVSNYSAVACTKPPTYFAIIHTLPSCIPQMKYCPIAMIITLRLCGSLVMCLTNSPLLPGRSFPFAPRRSTQKPSGTVLPRGTLEGPPKGCGSQRHLHVIRSRPTGRHCARAGNPIKRVNRPRQYVVQTEQLSSSRSSASSRNLDGFG